MKSIEDTHVPIEIKSKSLYFEDFKLKKAGDLYNSIGLIRKRKIYLVKDINGQELAFAILDFTSEGVNLSGLLDTFSIYPLVEKNKSNINPRYFLLAYTIKQYFKFNKRTAILLTKDENIDEYISFGFLFEKEYICFSATREILSSILIIIY